MSRAEKIAILLLVGLCIIGMLALKAGADVAGSYGVSEFHNPTHIPRDGLIERWLLDPGLSGDMTSNTGDFEKWTGAEGGCTNCPDGWTCDCTAGDIVEENLNIYKGSSSIKVSPVFPYYPNFGYPFTFEANKCYQLTFCYKGIAGTEDFYFLATNGTLTETYDPTTDTWTAPISGILVNNAGTDWICDKMYVRTGPVTKTPYAVAILTSSNNGTGVYYDNFEIRELDSCGVAGERGNFLSVPVTADPIWGDSEALQHKPGSGLATERGMWLDGTDDSLYRNDDGTFDPCASGKECKMTVGCRMISNVDDATYSTPISKYTGTPNSEWLFFRWNDDFYFYVSKDGTGNPGSFTQINDATCLFVDSLTSFVGIYDGTGVDGNSSITLNLDNRAQISSAAAVYPVYDGAAALRVGANSGPSSEAWNGSIGECFYAEKAWNDVQINKYINPYFPATRHGQGFYVTSCEQAVSHSTCTLEYCRDGTPDACQAEGTGVMAIFQEQTEYCVDNSFEVLTGDDSNPTFTNWSKGATGDITAYRADKVHGDISVRFTTEAGQYSSITSNCIAVSPSTTYFLNAKTKKLSGDPRYLVSFLRYSDGACNTYIGAPDPYDGPLNGNNWYDDLNVAVTTTASTNSVMIRLYSYMNAGDMLIDAVSFKECASAASCYRTPWVYNDGPVSSGYNDRPYVLLNPLSQWSDELQEQMYESGFCYSSWVYTDWSADGEFHVFYTVPTTGGTDNVHYLYKYTNDILYFEIYDGAGSSIWFYSDGGAITNTTWTAGNWKYIEACSSNTGTLRAHYFNVANSTWYNFTGPSGGGTGIQDDQSDEFHIGHQTGGNYCDCYFSEIRLVPYSAIYPMAGWNGGRPPGWAPVNGRPY